MSDPATQSRTLALPTLEHVVIRSATMDDLAFIDALQKQNSDRVGFMQNAALRAKIEQGQVLVASAEGMRVGYVMGTDRYFKREDVGIVYQINVVPGNQRGLIGAALLKAMFDRAAYGCRLFCCWCAQDIEANHFWEAMGFVPLAFRAGSEAKARVHIFWQKRIRAGDATTPYWFPSQTTGGSIREDRLVLPIPPGTDWSDAKPMILPTQKLPVASCQLPGKRKKKPVEPRKAVRRNGLWYDIPAHANVIAARKPKREKAKNDPKLIAAARELRDRWLEQVNAPGGEALLAPRGKYELTKSLPSAPIRALAA